MIYRNLKIRLVFLLLVLIMLFGVGTSLMEETFQPLVVTASWTDDNGNEKSVNAVSIPLADHQNSFWLYLPPESIGKNVTISIKDTLGQYQHGFSIKNGTNIADLNYSDAGDSLTSNPVTFSALSESGESLVDFNLYISASAETPKEMTAETEQPTEAPAETEEPTEQPEVTDEPTEEPTEQPAPTDEPTEEPTEQPEVTDTPTEAPNQDPVEVDVPVKCINVEDGEELIAAQTVRLKAGQQYMLLPSEIPDYKAIDKEAIVDVDENGIASPSEVVFKYSKIEPEKKFFNVKINYIDAQTNSKVATSSENSYEENTVLTIAPNPSDLMEGYTLVEGQNSFEHTLTDNFETSFLYTKKQEQVSLKISYIDSSTGKKLLDDKELVLSEGVNTISAEQIEDYQVIGATSVDVSLTNGVASQTELVFNYEKKQKPKPVIDILFVDEQGKQIANKQTVELSEGMNSIRAEEELGEYKLLNPSENVKYVEVNNGVPEVNELSFTYSLKKTENEAPKVAIVKVYYKTLDGRDLLEQPLSVTCVEGEDNVVSVDNSLYDAGRYTVSGESSKSVTVNENGEANPASVIFYFKDNHTVNEASVIVHYVDENNVDIIPAFSVTVKKGINKISFQQFEALKDYELVSADSFDVELFEDGRLSQGEVSFTLRKKAVETATSAPTETPSPTPTQEAATPTPKPEYSTRPIDGYVKPIRDGINFRTEPIKTNDSILRKLNANEVMQLDGLHVASDGSEWYYGRIGNTRGYVSKAHTKPLTKQEIADYLDLDPETNETEKPQEQRRGYAVARLECNMMQNPGDNNVIHSLSKNDLVFVTAQVEKSSEVWYKVEELKSHKIGFVQDYALSFISDEEAQRLLNAMAETPKPNNTTYKFTGLAKANGDNVPIRNYIDTNADIVHWLMNGDVVSVHGQQLDGNQTWHVVQIGDVYGFVRADQLKPLTQEEEKAYIESLRVTLPPVITPKPYDSETALSSYGYANASKLRLRKQPTQKSSYTKMLEKGSLLMIYSSVTGDDGKLWYKVNSDGETGYVRGDFVNVLTTKELNEYLQKKRNESKQIGNSKNNSNLNLSSIEDYNKEVWKDSNFAKKSFEPFKPPVTPSVSYTSSPTPEASQSVAPSVSPSVLPSEDTLPSNTPEPLKKQGSNFGNTLLGIVLLMFIGGGVAYGYYMYRANKIRQQKKNAKLSRDIAEVERSRKAVEVNPSNAPMNSALNRQRRSDNDPSPSNNDMPNNSRANLKGTNNGSLFQAGMMQNNQQRQSPQNDFRASRPVNNPQRPSVRPANPQPEPTIQLSSNSAANEIRQANRPLQGAQPRPINQNAQRSNMTTNLDSRQAGVNSVSQREREINSFEKPDSNVSFVEKNTRPVSQQNNPQGSSDAFGSQKPSEEAKPGELSTDSKQMDKGDFSTGTIEFTRAKPNVWPRAEELRSANIENNIASLKAEVEKAQDTIELKPQDKPEIKPEPKPEPKPDTKLEIKPDIKDETISFDRQKPGENQGKIPVNSGNKKHSKKRIRNY